MLSKYWKVKSDFCFPTLLKFEWGSDLHIYFGAARGVSLLDILQFKSFAYSFSYLVSETVFAASEQRRNILLSTSLSHMV